MKSRRKTTPSKTSNKLGAVTLGKANDLIQRKKLAEGLDLLNKFTKTASPLLQRRSLALVADASLRRGDAIQAADIFNKLRRSESNPASWLRASIGELRAQLTAANFQEARLVTTAILDTARQREIADQQVQANLPASLSAGSSINISPRPPRASVVATRMATQFMRRRFNICKIASPTVHRLATCRCVQSAYSTGSTSLGCPQLCRSAELVRASPLNGRAPY